MKHLQSISKRLNSFSVYRVKTHPSSIWPCRIWETPESHDLNMAFVPGHTRNFWIASAFHNTKFWWLHPGLYGQSSWWHADCRTKRRIRRHPRTNREPVWNRTIHRRPITHIQRPLHQPHTLWRCAIQHERVHAIYRPISTGWGTSKPTVTKMRLIRSKWLS